MAVFFTSDTHFGHAAVRGRYKRPFASLAEMNDGLAARWNETVAPADEVWHLGDFAIGLDAAAMAALLERLQGRKHLIAGNNDPAATRALDGWASVADYRELEIEGVRLVLCHYPFRTWNGMYKGALNLHGHSHGALKPLPRQIDVGVDAWDWRPVPLQRLSQRRRAAAPG